MENKKFDLKEISRDLMALGSIPFLLLVLIRIYILQIIFCNFFRLFLEQF
ncbi:MAG: hypothetical protein AABX83_01915 [Nanoarchaeota archaeon]